MSDTEVPEGWPQPKGRYEDVGEVLQAIQDVECAELGCDPSIQEQGSKTEILAQIHIRHNAEGSE